MRKALLVAGLFLFFLLVGGIYYWKTQQSQIMLQKYTQQTTLTRNTFNSGDFTTAIANAQTLLSQASNNGQRAQAELFIASSLASRDQGDDSANAVAMLQKINDDYSVTPLIRALAIHTMASIVVEKDIPFYKKTVTSAPLNTYLPKSGSDSYKLREVFFNLLKQSDEIYPTSSTEYEMAGNYYYWRILGDSALSAKNKEIYATLMQKYVMEADSRADSEQSLYSPGGILLSQFYRARSLSLSGDILNNLPLEAREAAYQKAMTTGNTYEQNGSFTNPFVRAVALRIRFYYADFLLINFNGKRTTDIQTILKPFADTNSLNPVIILGDLKNAPNTDVTKIEALKLSTISSDFKKFLLGMGLQISQ